MLAEADEVVLPAGGWAPRPHQMALWRFLEGGGKRAFYVWHRRAGKDDVGLHWTACEMVERVGTYWYMLPLQTQGRKAIWEAVNPRTQRRRIDDAFPKALRRRTIGDTMMIEFANGSTWQVVGSDNYDALVGSPPIGIVASEWALAKPAAWAYLRPILAENDGWVLFNTTPRGKNHAFRMLQGARSDTRWFTQVLPVAETDVFTPEQLAIERRELVNDYGEAVGAQMFEQEYECSFEQPVVGAIYAAELKAARDEARIGRVPYDPLLSVSTWWDIGGAGQGGDATAVWFVQTRGLEVRCVRYHEATGKDFGYYAKVCRDLPYRYDTHWLPHDARAKFLGTGRSIEEMARGYRDGTTGEQVAPMLSGNVSIAPAMNVEDRINAARMLFPRVWIDETNCEQGIDALSNYRREWVDKLGQLAPVPLHDWASHGSDAFGEIALTVREAGAKRKTRERERSRDTGGSGWA